MAEGKRPLGARGGVADAIGQIDAGKHSAIPPTSANRSTNPVGACRGHRAPVIGQPKLVVPSWHRLASAERWAEPGASARSIR
jgi:hypothetical protein